MIISMWQSEKYPQLRVELDIADVAELFKRQTLVITMGTNTIFTTKLSIYDIPVPVDVSFGDKAVGASMVIEISENAFCDLLKAGSAKYCLRNGECVAIDKEYTDYDEEQLIVILNISKRGM